MLGGEPFDPPDARPLQASGMNILALFRRQIQVARVTGIPVRIDYRWFLVFALSAWVIAVSFREGTTMTQFVRLEAAAEVLRDEPRREREDEEPAVVDVDGDAEDPRDAKLPVEDVVEAHKSTQHSAVSGQPIRPWLSG